jgi:hypothetical protein
MLQRLKSLQQAGLISWVDKQGYLFRASESAADERHRGPSMWEWIHAHHDDLQALGPVATIFAALVASGVAATFGFFQYQLGKAQRWIARSQRDIALEKLKLDAFRERYLIYAAARALTRYLSRSHNSGIGDDKVNEWLGKIDESLFFFSGAQLQILDRIASLSMDLILTGHIVEDFDDSMSAVEKASKVRELKELRFTSFDLYTSLPKVFAKEFDFSEVAKKSDATISS